MGDLFLAYQVRCKGVLSGLRPGKNIDFPHK